MGRSPATLQQPWCQPRSKIMATHNIALVTGASSGIGAATAQALAAAGWTTYATARQAARVVRGAGIIPLALDVTDSTTMEAAVAQIEATHGAISLLVNNAGYGQYGPVEELTPEAIRQQFETNVFGLVRMCQLVLPGMRGAGRGRIINIGSIGGTFTAPGAGAYHASKWALESFTDALRYEVQGFGVDVVLVQPTGVATRFDHAMAATMPDTGPNSPYAAFKANHLRATAQMFAAGSWAGIVQADDVARVIMRAAHAKRPRTRYKVGWSAYVFRLLRHMLSDRIWDRLMGMQFPLEQRG
jgi:NAD(P)-dependent dehydrogenase (short-subunit alcohol dehydrogenase family)